MVGQSSARSTLKYFFIFLFVSISLLSLIPRDLNQATESYQWLKEERSPQRKLERAKGREQMDEFSRRLTITPVRKFDWARPYCWKDGDETGYSEMRISRIGPASAYVDRLTETLSRNANYYPTASHGCRTHNYFPMNTSPVTTTKDSSKSDTGFRFMDVHGCVPWTTVLVVSSIGIGSFVVVRLSLELYT
jgi:hypothetical protein